MVISNHFSMYKFEIHSIEINEIIILKWMAVRFQVCVGYRVQAIFLHVANLS